MTDFSYLEKLSVQDDATSEYTFHDIVGHKGGAVTLVVTPAGEPNKRYFSALTRYALKNRRAMQNNTNILADSRDLDRRLYAQHIVSGWKNVPDAKGDLVEFSHTRCSEFLGCLPDEMFDELREHCANLDNFKGIAPEEAEFAAKNLPSGSSGKSD